MWSTTKLYTFIANTLNTFDCERQNCFGIAMPQKSSIKPKLHFQTGVHSIKGTISKCYKGLKQTTFF